MERCTPSPGLTGHAAGTSQVVDASNSWATRAMFLLQDQAAAPQDSYVGATTFNAANGLRTDLFTKVADPSDAGAYVKAVMDTKTRSHTDPRRVCRRRSRRTELLDSGRRLQGGAHDAIGRRAG